ncbi:hypothetical protein ACRAWD_02295 [Caulobacter segnis]
MADDGLTTPGPAWCQCLWCGKAQQSSVLPDSGVLGFRQPAGVHELDSRRLAPSAPAPTDERVAPWLEAPRAAPCRLRQPATAPCGRRPQRRRPTSALAEPRTVVLTLDPNLGIGGAGPPCDTLREVVASKPPPSSEPTVQ